MCVCAFVYVYVAYADMFIEGDEYVWELQFETGWENDLTSILREGTYEITFQPKGEGFLFGFRRVFYRLLKQWPWQRGGVVSHATVVEIIFGHFADGPKEVSANPLGVGKDLII